MINKKEVGIGALLIVILSASVYVILPNEERIEIIEGNEYEIITKEIFKEEIVLENYTCIIPELITIYENITVSNLGVLNESCENIIGKYCNNSYSYSHGYTEYINKTSTCLRKIRINVSKGFIPIGKIKVNGTIIKEDRYFCGLDNKGIICDEKYDEDGGIGDGNGDGICQEGETCVRK